jgi:ParB family chromosome partitioning protein
MPVQWLTAHPGNVRGDLDLSGEFVASIAENGVLVPLRITIDGQGDAERYRVIDGHRRLAAAIKAGLAEVPYDMAAGRNADEAGQYLDMYNAHHHRKGLTRLEEADALFSANTVGATRTRIRKSTGLKAGQVKAALAAAALTDDARVSVGALGHNRGDGLTLEDLAVMAEFQDDRDALSRLMSSAVYHDGLEHEAERLRQERAERSQHEKLRADLEAGGLTITDSLPPGAMRCV